MNPKVRNKFSPKIQVEVEFTEESRVQEHFQNSTNVNHIMARYQKTGDASILNRVRTEYGTFDQFQDLSQYTSKLARAEEAFSALPQSIQKQFDWQPSKMLEFIDDPRNFDEAVKIGLFKPKEVPKPDPVLETLNEIKNNTAIKRRFKKDEPE